MHGLFKKVSPQHDCDTLQTQYNKNQLQQAVLTPGKAVLTTPTG
jgi:hypothetical protein